jgi:hypothetical protein
MVYVNLVLFVITFSLLMFERKRAGVTLPPMAIAAMALLSIIPYINLTITLYIIGSYLIPWILIKTSKE